MTEYDEYDDTIETIRERRKARRAEWGTGSYLDSPERTTELIRWLDQQHTKKPYCYVTEAPCKFCKDADRFGSNRSVVFDYKGQMRTYFFETEAARNEFRDYVKHRCYVSVTF
jgi:hypothetical protein